MIPVVVRSYLTPANCRRLDKCAEEALQLLGEDTPHFIL
jgi:hypothetical protein